MVSQDNAKSEFRTLQAEYQERFAPATWEERYLVCTLVRSEWLSRQLGRLETAIWDRQLAEEQGMPVHSLAAAFGRACGELDRISRAIDSMRRVYRRALKRLTALQSSQKPGLFVVPKRS